MASVAVSLCLLGVLAAMYRSLFVSSQANPAQAVRIIVHHRVSITQPLPVSYSKRIQALPGVRNVMIWQWFGGSYKDARDPRNFFARFAVEPAKVFDILSELELPKERQVAFQRLRTGCIVSRKLAAKFNWKINDRVRLIGDIFPVNPELTIVGIHSTPEDQETLFFNYAYLRELRIAAGESGADEVGVLAVKANSPDDVERVIETIDREFDNSPAATKSETERAWQLSFISFLGNLKLFVFTLSGALTLAVLAISANTISISVRERVREVAILKTLGFTPGTILWIILGESTFIAFLGGLFGLVLSEIVCLVVRNSKSIFAALEPGITPGVAFLLLLTAAAIGLAGSILPAWAASRRPILDSLRYSG